MGWFSFLVFLNPMASILQFWMVFCFGNHFLFESILAGCGLSGDTNKWMWDHAQLIPWLLANRSLIMKQSLIAWLMFLSTQALTSKYLFLSFLRNYFSCTSIKTIIGNGNLMKDFFAFVLLLTKCKSENKVWGKKRDLFKNWPLIKIPHFLSNPHETLPK